MWQKIKLTIFFSLLILGNLARAQETTTFSAVTENSIENNSGDQIAAGNRLTENVEAASGDGEIIDNLNEIVETQTYETDSKSSTDGEYVTTFEPTTSRADSTNELQSTTESETVNDKIDCICNCSANGSQVKVECSTQVPNETETATSSNSENDNSEINTLEPNPTSTSSNENPESTSAAETADDTTTAPVTSEKPETTSESNTLPETTTTTITPPPCSKPGVQPHELDCKQYYDCSSQGFLDGSFHLLSKSCPGKQVFNNVLNRCSRDISSCSNPIECLAKGGVADPASNTSYYLCEPRLIGGGFRIFHVDCSSNEIFYPELGKCFVDFNNLPTQIYPPYGWNQIEDIDIVKAELKLLKEQDKLKLKQAKEQQKAEEKLQKQLEKDAKKRAKDEAKTFVCAEEGNFASAVSENIYYACITKKDKLKAYVMQCPINSKFSAATGTCLQNTTTNNNNDD